MEEDEYTPGEEATGGIEPKLDSTEVGPTVEVSLNSVVGLPSPKTVKIWGSIGNH